MSLVRESGGKFGENYTCKKLLAMIMIKLILSVINDRIDWRIKVEKEKVIFLETFFIHIDKHTLPLTKKCEFVDYFN